MIFYIECWSIWNNRNECAGMEIGKSGWGVWTSLGRGPGAAQAPVGAGATPLVRGLGDFASQTLTQNYHLKGKWRPLLISLLILNYSSTLIKMFTRLTYPYLEFIGKDVDWKKRRRSMCISKKLHVMINSDMWSRPGFLRWKKSHCLNVCVHQPITERKSVTELKLHSS